jgi:hypothetical protein
VALVSKGCGAERGGGPVVWPSGRCGVGGVWAESKPLGGRGSKVCWAVVGAAGTAQVMVSRTVARPTADSDHRT